MHFLHLVGQEGEIETFSSEFVGPFADIHEANSWLQENGFSKLKVDIATREGRSFFHRRCGRTPFADKVWARLDDLNDPRESKVDENS